MSVVDRGMVGSQVRGVVARGTSGGAGDDGERDVALVLEHVDDVGQSVADLGFVDLVAVGGREDDQLRRHARQDNLPCPKVARYPARFGRVSASAVGTHVGRALVALKASLGPAEPGPGATEGEARDARRR
jgi:hypothetical protein